MNFNTLIQAIWNRKLRFLSVFFLVFILTYTVLYALDYLPETPTEAIKSEAAEISDTTQLQPAGEEVLNIEIFDTEVNSELEGEALNDNPVSASQTVLPSSIYIKKLDKTITVLNPESRTIAALDTALLEGVVRHPDSATLDQEGNVFILGHSSYLPMIRNKNFQAFNGIQNLAWGDVIEITGGDNTYIYRVEKVYQAKASEVTVPIAGTGNMLTIATCNSFGSTDDRYIVEATLVRTIST